MTTLTSVNPATGEVLARREEHEDAEVERRLSRAVEVFRLWRRRPVAERAHLMARAADVLEAGKERYGKLMTQEMGKTLKSAIGRGREVRLGLRLLRRERRALPGRRARRDRRQRALRALPPARPGAGGDALELPLLAGVPLRRARADGRERRAPQARLQRAQCALAIEEVFRRPAFPEGVFQTLLVGLRAGGAADRGPARGGRHPHRQRGARAVAVAARPAGRSRSPCSSWAAATPSSCCPRTPTSTRGRDRGRGAHREQRPVLHRRQAVHRPRGRRTTRSCRASSRGCGRCGWATRMDPATDVGPLVSPADRRASCTEQVERLVRDGARVLTGGKLLDGPGAFYPPTVLADVPRACAALPRGAVRSGGGGHQACGTWTRPSASPTTRRFGLGRASWTATRRSGPGSSRARGGRDLRERDGRSPIPRLPFGGVKRSGYGRELSREGIREFVNVKTVVVRA